MFTYITAEQFNQMNWNKLQDKPFADGWSRYIIKSLLAKYSPNTKSIYEYQGNNCLDLKLTMQNGSHLGIEIKFRKDPSTTFPSHLINSEKFEAICRRMDKKLIQGAFLTSVWYDGVIWCSNIVGEHTVEQHF